MGSHGRKMSRDDHGAVSNQLYANYAMGKDSEAMKAVVGEEALTDDQKLYMEFMEKFENRFISQGRYENRSIFDSLDKAWELLRLFKKDALNKVKKKIRDKYYTRKAHTKD